MLRDRQLRQGKDGAPISVSRRRKNYFRARGRKVRICDAATLETEVRLERHTGEIRGLTFSPDGKRLASAAFDRTAAVWELTSH